MNDRTTIHISKPTKEERALLRLLSSEERLAALVDAARRKAGDLTVRSVVRSEAPNRAENGPEGRDTAEK